VAYQSAWLFVARVAFFTLIGRVLRDVLRQKDLFKIWILALLLAACAP
jgi:hypothetical protein